MMKKGATVLLALFALSLVVLFTACPNVEEKKVTLTITGDEHVTVNSSQLAIPQGAKWNEVKKQINQAISFDTDYRLKEWRIENEAGELIGDETVFSKNKTFFAKSYPCAFLLTFKGASEVTFEEPTFGIKTRNTKWSEIKALLTDNVKLPNETTELTGWKLTPSESDPFIDDDYIFTTDSEIYASTEKTKFMCDGKEIITGYIGTPTKLLFPAKVGTQKVFEIRDSLFENEATLTSIDFSTVTHLTILGKYSFSNCTKLREAIQFPASLQEIGGSLYTLGSFANCTQLTEVDFSRCTNLLWIRSSAFYNCTELTGSLDFTRCEKLTAIDSEAFYKTKITTVRFPASLRRVNGFSNCKQLTEVDFSRCVNLTTIREYAFYLCTGLRGTLDLSECTKLTKIGERAFYNCTQAEIKLPLSIETIERNAFGEESDSSLCKKVLILATPAEDFERIKALVVGSGYPESRIESY